MSESTRHRLELWFMRDLRDFDRAPLFLLFGITHPGSNLEQQKAFKKILDDCASPLKDHQP